ncbi:glycosyltransferase family protein [Pelosinus propionicus]|uniref:Glycosyltransferase involved in cell wall bisynthesis n=1 Tax=Pelosinus propionicus DSM 13327 TaxID=1123291 RepID=A0A1I4MP61_9FIRM|nr:glycosyltransferase [Pelosinus propionicus]SFM05018.1 Glycosyltransferase involved in cell wall bisynthesis [Pelosinus propionicus DSM 13327]
MKIAYLLTWDIYSNDGVTKKVNQQVKEWRNLGHTIEIFCVLPKNNQQNKQNEKCKLNSNIYELLNNTIFLKFIGPGNLIKSILDFQPDIMYLRFETFKLYIYKLINIIPTVVEINTNDIAEIRLVAQRNCKYKINYYYNLLTRGYLFRNVSGIVGVTSELIHLASIEKYEKPAIDVPNGIDTLKFPLLKQLRQSNEIPHLVFMGTPGQSWHGVDKILYLAKKTIGKLEFHIIGLEEKGRKSENVTFYGYLSKDEYEKVLKKADVGIGTLALHRNKMNEACPLKVREYLSYGLPIIIGYKDSAFNSLKMLPEWVLQLSNCENNVKDSVDKIVEFAKQVKDKIIDKNECSIIDIKSTEKRRIEFIMQIWQRGMLNK